ncbi:hypothetical protein CDAR_21801 [Caerostris darwini]|uniref:Uncharacterized protein n=1 Tax=Caerostris darwini TaxID=1538125 RepID=A0AAV4TJK7_9ARAC|nr:hypothetical protein CDAR_21801 [Caerostris darwini]
MKVCERQFGGKWFPWLNDAWRLCLFLWIPRMPVCLRNCEVSFQESMRSVVVVMGQQWCLAGYASDILDKCIQRPKPSKMEQFFPKAAITAKSRYFNSAENAADVIPEHRSIIQDSGEALISRNSRRRILITTPDF